MFQFLPCCRNDATTKLEVVRWAPCEVEAIVAPQASTRVRLRGTVVTRFSAVDQPLERYVANDDHYVVTSLAGFHLAICGRQDAMASDSCVNARAGTKVLRR